MSLQRIYATDLVRPDIVDRRRDAGTRLDATYKLGLPVLEPRTKWIGDKYNGVVPVSTCIQKFVPDTITDGIHV